MGLSLIALALAAVYLNRGYGAASIVVAALATASCGVVWNRRGNWPALDLTTIVSLLAMLVSVCLFIYKLYFA